MQHDVCFKIGTALRPSSICGKAQNRSHATLCCLAPLFLNILCAPISAQTVTRQPSLNVTGIGGITIGAAVNEALAANPTVRSAAQLVAQAQARLGQAQAQRRLQISLNSALSGSNADVIQGPPSSESFGTLQNTITIPLNVGNRSRLAALQADAQVAAALAQYEAARLSLTNQVESAYYDVLRKDDILTAAEDTQAEAQRQLDDVQKRNRAGDVPDLDVLRAQVPLASANAALYQARNDLAVARETLDDLLGEPLDADLRLAGDIDTTSSPTERTLDESRLLAVQNSPDVRASDAAVRAAEASLAAVKLSREPAYSLQASDARSSDLTSFSRIDTIQASVTIPLSDGGLATSQIQEAEAALKQAQSEAEIARHSAQMLVSNAYLTAESNRQQAVASKIALDIAQTTYDKTALGYQNGLYPLSDVLNAQVALGATRSAYTQALYDSALAARMLENLLGAKK
jgi:outer membrane protein